MLHLLDLFLFGEICALCFLKNVVIYISLHANMIKKNQVCGQKFKSVDIFAVRGYSTSVFYGIFLPSS